MAKTYTAAGTVAAGDVATAAAWNVLTVDVNNLIVPPMCRVEKTATMNVLTSSDTLVTWDAEEYDTDAMVTLASSTSQITITTPGIYILTAGVSFSSNASGRRAIWVSKNGVNYSDNILGLNRLPANEASTLMQATTTIELANADVLRLYAFQSSGSTLTLPATTATAEAINTFLSLAWIGRTA